MRLDLIFEDLGDFVQAYKGRISIDGVVMEATTAQAEGTVLELTISLADQMVLINGKAGVLRTRERATLAGTLSTMILRFIELDEDSRSLIQRMEDRHQSEGITPFSLDEALARWPDPAVPSVSGGRPVPALAEGPPTATLPGPSGSAGASAPPEETADPTPASSPAEVYDMVSTALDSEKRERSAGSGPTSDSTDSPHRAAGLRSVVVLAVVAVAAAVIAVVVIFFPDLVGLGSGTEPAPAPTPVTVEATPTMVAAEPPTPSPVDDTPVAVAPSPTPPPTAAPPPIALDGGLEIINITWSAEAETTVVVITADAAVDPASFKQFRLTNAPGPREVLQISGIHRSELRYTTRVDGPRISAIRTWHHDERIPPELQVVFDLAGHDVTLESVATDGVKVVLRFAGSTAP